MAEYAKRPEVTVSTMGKVHNPSGEGVKAISVEVKKTKQKHQEKHKDAQHPQHAELHETKVGKEGSSKRNIQRKKTDGRDSGNFDSRNKKQGGHGKGQWKEELENLDDTDYTAVLNEKDPLYDELQEKNYILSSATTASTATNGGVAVSGAAAEESAHGEDGAPGDVGLRKTGFDPVHGKSIYGPLLTNSEFKIQLLECLKEYFDSCDADEVIRTLLELNCQEYHREIVKKAISLAMDKGPRERELTSRLLTSLHPTPMSDKDMELGFEALLDSLDDLSMDVPDAKTMAASFLARAVVDEVLPPAFLSEQNNARPGDAVVEKAVTLLNREHCTARLERVWGPGDGRPVEDLKKDMDQLLQEYLLSRELDEAARCVKELDASHFHHELVKRGVVTSMEMMDGGKDTLEHMDAMAALFGFLVRNAIVSEYQVKKGIARLHQRLPDISLDVPNAAKLLEEFEKLANESGCFGATKKAAAKDEQPQQAEESENPVEA